ncbi:Reverse transcriptase (RNA-dependent DNA polymerase) [Fragilaria crotonensis]|nr:Reverse transcriptase (RNA-dependent DNA polymerase) [Fragilaria crotonensis]
MEPKIKSIDSQRYAHIIGNGRGYTKAYPMERKNESIYALDDFVKKVGIPEVLLCDNDATMEGWGEWKKRIRKYSIDPKYTEPYSPFQNKAELDIRELKRMIRRFQDKTRSPRRLWNYLVNLCGIRSFVAGHIRIYKDALPSNRSMGGHQIFRSTLCMVAIDKRTGTDFWTKAIEKEIRNVFPAFEFIEDDDTKVPPGYEFVDTYFVFDIKMDLTRKARLVARGNMTEATKEQTFASVVSRDTVRLFFLLAALNDLDLLSCDIQNAYLAAPNKEKVWTKFTDQLGPEYNGKRAIIAKALYGLRSSGRSFRDYLAKNLRELGFASSKADPDLWMKAAVKPNGDKVYEYVISYVDDLIFQGIDPEGFMDALGQRFTLKPGSIKEPDTYLGVDIKKFRIPDSDEPDKVRWAFESTSYVKKAIADLEKELEDADLRLLPNAKTPLASGYRPELDLSAELGANN